MKRKMRILSLVLTALMVTGLGGCGNTDNSIDNTAPKNDTITNDQGTETDTSEVSIAVETPQTEEKTVEPDKKIVPKKWKEELDRLDEKSQKTEKAISNALVDLAKMEVLIYNKRDHERMLENERHQPSRSITKKRNDPSI